MNKHEAKEYLDSFINYEKTLDSIPSTAFKLIRVRRLLELLGDPQKNLKVIHVAGSKGKGSTCCMVSNILKEAGFKVGLYTSPHIDSYRERIRLLDSKNHKESRTDIFSDCISENDLAQCLTEIQPFIEMIKSDDELGRLSFYEIMTSLALFYFNKEKTDFVVLETGLGGRLDATNVVESMISVITPISLEHTHLLGDTLDLITREKQEIIKKKQPVVIAPQEILVKKVLKEHCASKGITPIDVSESVQFTIKEKDLDFQIIDLITNNERYIDLTVALTGQHQVVNATVAVSVIEAMQKEGISIPKPAIHKGLSLIYWPIRFEVMYTTPNFVIDGAHNPHSISKLVETVKQFWSHDRVHVIFGVSQDKDYKSMARELSTIAKSVIITKADHPRSKDFTEEEIKEIFPETSTQKTKSIQDAVAFAQKMTPRDDVVIITGSIFVASQARKYFNHVSV